MPAGVVVAVIDTGATAARLDAGRLVPGVNLSLDGPEDDTTDGHGHGTAIASTILGCGTRALVLPVKLMGDHGYLREAGQLEVAFEWILEQRARRGIAVVCAPFADASHLTTDASYRGTPLQRSIAALRDAGVPTVAPAGNAYAWNERLSPQGMAWPAILREVISVGAIERTPDGPWLSAHTARLHASLGTGCATTVFAEPGPPGGTSGAAAVIAGRLADLKAAHPAASANDLIERLLGECAIVLDATGSTWRALYLGAPHLCPSPRGGRGFLRNAFGV